jgi:FkbM family methyltransferase
MPSRLTRLLKSPVVYPTLQRLMALPHRLPAYPAFRNWRDTRALRRWTADDQLRFDFYRQFIRADELVFDIGANVGNRTKIFLRLGARVIAFEPQTVCADLLQHELSANPSFRLVRKALGASIGTGELQVANAHYLSTMSDDWVATTRKSGRFGNVRREQRQRISVTTLDEAIREFGPPAFAKIDVEGFEPQVLAGLTGPLASGSIEFAGEALDNTLGCIERLHGLSPCVFQFSEGESMQFSWQSWLTLDEARTALMRLVRNDRYAWGDVYFRAGHRRVRDTHAVRDAVGDDPMDCETDRSVDRGE